MILTAPPVGVGGTTTDVLLLLGFVPVPVALVAATPTVILREQS